MLGENDFKRELGKGICIYPFHESNLKENSYNLTIGQNAWSMGSGKITRRGEGKFTEATSNERRDVVKSINKGQSAIIEDCKKRYLILLPHTTTIVETSEVLGVDHRIGGTIHSKVGIVAQGIGDTSTMLGPCFCGHLMISLHNFTDDVVAFSVGDTFVSLIFYYLETPNAVLKNSNLSGHVDKLSELGIQISKSTREFLLEDWKQDINGIRDKLLKSESYTEYQKKERERGRESIKRYFSTKNIVILLILILALVGAFYLAYRVDRNTADTKWMDRYWVVILTCIIIPIFNGIKSLFDK